MDMAIEVVHLRKQYGSIVAVEDLSLSVPRGCLFGFLGPNGSGKSTTVGCLTGLLDPTAGEIRLLGTQPARSWSTAASAGRSNSSTCRSRAINTADGPHWTGSDPAHSPGSRSWAQAAGGTPAIH